MAGNAAKGPMRSDMTKELTNQNVSASLPVAAIIGAAECFSLRGVFFMADLLFSDVMAAQNHFVHRFAMVYTQGVCQKKKNGWNTIKTRIFFSNKNRQMVVFKKIIYMEPCPAIALFIALKKTNNAPENTCSKIILRPEYPLMLQA